MLLLRTLTRGYCPSKPPLLPDKPEKPAAKITCAFLFNSTNLFDHKSLFQFFSLLQFGSTHFLFCFIPFLWCDLQLEAGDDDDVDDDDDNNDDVDDDDVDGTDGN